MVAPTSKPSLTSTLIAAWGVFGVVALFLRALHRLTPIALEPLLDGSLGIGHAAIYVVWVIFNAYVEGYRAFQLRFSPRVVSRAFYLGENPKLWHVVLAPFFCMSFFHARRAGKIVAWALLVGIVTLVLLIRLLPQPWRGIIDGGVVVALAWGVLTLLYFFFRALAGHPSRVDPELPVEAQPAPT